jgi:hypothetical protein
MNAEVAYRTRMRGRLREGCAAGCGRDARPAAGGMRGRLREERGSGEVQRARSPLRAYSVSRLPVLYTSTKWAWK